MAAEFGSMDFSDLFYEMCGSPFTSEDIFLQDTSEPLLPSTPPNLTTLYGFLENPLETQSSQEIPLDPFLPPFDDLFYEMCGLHFTSEDTFLQDTSEPFPPSISPNLTTLYGLLENPLETQSSQEIAPDPSLPPLDDVAPSNSSPQIVATVNGGVISCVICLATVPQLPPVPAPQIAVSHPLKFRKIPQTLYDQGRKQWDFRPSEPIFFHVDGCPGIKVGNALRKKFAGLDRRDEPVLQHARGAISCRISFPGYPLNSSPQISTKYWNKGRDPITRSTLAYHVAKKLKDYLDSMASSYSIDGSTDKQWEIGKGIMHFDNMFLVRLDSVSMGSFQPEIWVADPTM